MPSLLSSLVVLLVLSLAAGAPVSWSVGAVPYDGITHTQAPGTLPPREPLRGASQTSDQDRYHQIDGDWARTQPALEPIARLHLQPDIDWTWLREEVERGLARLREEGGPALERVRGQAESGLAWLREQAEVGLPWLREQLDRIRGGETPAR